MTSRLRPVLNFIDYSTSKVLWTIIQTVFLRFDKAVAVLIWDEFTTVSAIADRKAVEGNRAAIGFCRFLDIFDKEHCKEAASRGKT